MKTLPLIIAIIMLAASASAVTCVTVLNSPTNDPLYWRAVSYDVVADGKYTADEWLSRTSNPGTPGGLGPGNTYATRMDKDCFGGWLPTPGATGIMSTDLTIQQDHRDLRATDPASSQMYTVSSTPRNLPPRVTVGSTSLALIDDVNYLQLPPSRSSPSPLYASIKAECDKDLMVETQLEIIRERVWDLVASGVHTSCTWPSIVDCSLSSGKASDSEEATIIVLLARECGVPTRIVHGISGGNYDGINIYLSEGQATWWIEYYANGAWYPFWTSTDPAKAPPGVETNCVDGVDNDGDGMADCQDSDCIQSFNYECSAKNPYTLKYANAVSTPVLSISNPRKVENFILGNANGNVEWQGPIDLRNRNLDLALDVQPGMVILTAAVPSMNVPATATLNNVMLTQPVVLKDNATCTQCQTVKYRSDSLSFTIPGAGNYTAIEASTLALRRVNATTTQVPVNTSATTSDWKGIIATKLNDVKDWFFGLELKYQVVTVLAVLAGLWLIKFIIDRKRYG